MNKKYEFVTGEVIEVEISGDIAEVILEMEMEDYKSNRRETRRHNSIDSMKENAFQFEDETIDVISIFEAKEMSKELHDAINKLKLPQKELVQKIFFQGISITQISKEDGISKAGVISRLNKIYKNLKKFLN